MSKYIQHAGGIVHSIMDSPGAIVGPGVVEVPTADERYLGAYFDGTNFRKLELIGGEVALNVNLVVQIHWVDIDGNIVPVNGTVQIICGGLTEEVTITDGIGIMPFESPEIGEFILIATSPEGCKAEGKVIVQ